MRINILLFLFSFSLIPALAQQKPAPKPLANANAKKPVAPDCDKAISIDLSKTMFYGPTAAPDGPGEQEITFSRKNIFEEEHNTAWYQVKIARDGDLVFDISPADTTNDYDFLLFPIMDSTFCVSFKKGKALPLRNNLSNVKYSRKGVTGLKTSASSLSIGKGPGDPYSRSLPVKKGEHYMLVLDNVHPEGQGHSITFNYIKDVTIKGKVLDSDSIPVVGEITLSDNKGNTVLETKTDKNGDYKIQTKLVENQNYSFSIISENTFVDIRNINTNTHKDANDIRVMLPKLKKGEKYKLGNINFYGDSPQLLEGSFPSVAALYKLMHRNKKMVIEIDGHTNGYDWKAEPKDQSDKEKRLSEDRANVIYTYLINKGINANRMTKKGFGSTQPLYKTTAEPQGAANRRVEIKVISLD